MIARTKLAIPLNHDETLILFFVIYLLSSKNKDKNILKRLLINFINSFGTIKYNN